MFGNDLCVPCSNHALPTLNHPSPSPCACHPRRFAPDRATAERDRIRQQVGLHAKQSADSMENFVSRMEQKHSDISMKQRVGFNCAHAACRPESMRTGRCSFN